jgi:hypothetical protein
MRHALVLCVASCAYAFAPWRVAPSRPRGAAPGARRGAARAAPAMAALSPGDSVLVLGSGPVMAITAKQCVAAGYKTTIIGGVDAPKYREMMFSADSPAPPQSDLAILESVEGEQFSVYNTIATSCDGVIVANDRELVPSDSMLDTMIPPANINLKRVVVMSRNLNGKGLGPFAMASKISANAEVWAGGAKIAEYEAFEAKVRAKAAEVGGDCDCVIVRAGTLKGGGPGDSTTTEGAPAAQTLTKAFYDQYSRDIVNWPLLFDAATLGVSLTPGDTAEGPGFQAAFTATSDGACKGDSSRVNVASALVRALGRDGVAWQDFGVTTAAGRNSPTDAEWDAEFAKVLAGA